MQPTLCSQAVDSLGKTRFVSACRILFDDAFLHRPVNDTECRSQQRLRIPRFSCGNGGAQFFHLSPQLMTIHLIDEPPLLALTIALDRGWMVCHLVSFKKRKIIL